MNQITTCPHCSQRLGVSEQITDKTLICPHCLADVENPRPGSLIQAPNLNTDVKRDVSASSIGLAVLIALGVIGVVIAGGFAPFLGCGAIAVFVIIAILRTAFTRLGVSGAPTSTAEKVIGTLFLVLGTLAAIVLFTFFACAIAISNMQFGR